MCKSDLPPLRELRVTVEPIGPRALWRIKAPVVIECDDLVLGALGRNVTEGRAEATLRSWGRTSSHVRLMVMALRSLGWQNVLLVLALLVTGQCKGERKEVWPDVPA